MNDRIEEQLREALRRVEPSQGFAERVVTRLPEPQSRSFQRFWFAAVAACVALLLVFTIVHQNRRERMVQAHETERQVVFAIALAVEKLDHVNARLQKSAPEVRIEDKKGERL